MTGNLLTTVEQIIARVDPDHAAFLSMRLALVEAALGEPGRALERLEALPEFFFAAGSPCTTSEKLPKVIFGAPAEVAAGLIERMEAPLRTNYLIRAAHARYEAGDQAGAEWLVRQAEAHWGGLEPLLRSYAGVGDRLGDIPAGLGAWEACWLAEIRIDGAMGDLQPIDDALSRVIADDDPLEYEDAESRDRFPDPSRMWLHALTTLIRLRLRTGDLAGTRTPLERLSPWLEDGAVLWEILRHPGGASVLRDPRNDYARVQAVLLADVIDALVADDDIEGTHAVLDLIHTTYRCDVRFSRAVGAVAEADARTGEFERAAAVAEARGSAWLKVEVLLGGYRATGDRRYIDQARQTAEKWDMCVYHRMLAEVLVERGELEEAASAAHQSLGHERLRALKTVARAHLERGDTGAAAALLDRGPGMEHQWYRMAARAALAELQVERGEMEAALETTLSISKLPADGIRRFWRWRPEPHVLQERYSEQVPLLRTIARGWVRGPGQEVPPWVPALRDPFLRAVCLLEIACPLPDERP